MSNYSPVLTDKLVCGFSNGFELGHYGDPCDTKVNHRLLSRLHTFHLRNNLEVEISAGRIIGPFDTPPFNNFQVSPLSIREKKTPGKFRLIHNLSYPYDGTSVNDNIDSIYKSVKYANVYQAINLLTSMKIGSFTAKSDIKHAFRLIPIRREDHSKLGIFFEGHYYYDTTLPMGSASSCKLFEEFSCAIHHIVQFHIPKCKMIHYLDDFLFMAESEVLCQEYLNVFSTICADIGVPLSLEKTTKPSNSTTFLGITLDTVTQEATLPKEKIDQYCSDLNSISKRRSIKKRDLQSIIGKLAFASSVVPARAFLRRMINLMSQSKQLHHYITISREVKKDINTWLTFLNNYNGRTFFRTQGIINSDAINMCSDASKLGFGATFERYWIQCKYPVNWSLKDITVLELYPIYVMLSLFGHSIKNTTVLFLCDNYAIVNIINKQSSKDTSLMDLVRDIVLVLMKHNIHLVSRHIPGRQNTLCDKISRLQNVTGHLKKASMNLHPTPIPHNLLPENYSST